MSITRLALRICAVEALKNNTLVGNSVYNSRHGVLDSSRAGEITTSEERPFIAVYTETSIDREESGFLLRSNTNLDFIFEFAIAQCMSIQKEDGSSFFAPFIPDTDEGMECYLDIVETGISAALRDEKNAWAEVWRKLAGRVVETEHRRISNETEGTSLAAHQLRLRLDAVIDPVLGEKIGDGSAWASFLYLLQKYNNPWASVILPMFKEDQNAGSNRNRFGLTLEQARSLAVE